MISLLSINASNSRIISFIFIIDLSVRSVNFDRSLDVSLFHLSLSPNYILLPIPPVWLNAQGSVGPQRRNTFLASLCYQD